MDTAIAQSSGTLAPLTTRPPLPPLTSDDATDPSRTTEPNAPGRRALEMRPIFMRTGVSEFSSGSCYMSQGCTKVLCSVFGPRPCRPQERVGLQRTTGVTESGTLHVDVTFTPFSRLGRGRVTKASGGLGQAFKGLHDFVGTLEEERLVHRITEAFQSVVLLERFPNALVEICVLIVENEGSVTSVAINCVSMALADAGIPLRDLCISVVVAGMPVAPSTEPAEKRHCRGLGHTNLDAFSLEPASAASAADKKADTTRPGASTGSDASERLLAPVIVDPIDTELALRSQALLTTDPAPCGEACAALSKLYVALCAGDLSVALFDVEGILLLPEGSASDLLAVAETACGKTAMALRRQLRAEMVARTERAKVETALTADLLVALNSKKDVVPDPTASI